MFLASIDINSPYGHQAEDIVIDVVLKRDTVCVWVEEIFASHLNSLFFLHSEDHLYNVFVSVASEFSELVFGLISNLPA